MKFWQKIENILFKRSSSPNQPSSTTNDATAISNENNTNNNIKRNTITVDQKKKVETAQSGSSQPTKTTTTTATPQLKSSPTMTTTSDELTSDELTSDELTSDDLEFVFEIDSMDKLAARSRTFLKKLARLERLVRSLYLTPNHVTPLFDYARLVKQLVYVAELARKCTRQSVWESNRRVWMESNSSPSSYKLVPVLESRAVLDRCREIFLRLTSLFVWLTYSSRVFRLKLAQFDGLRVLLAFVRTDHALLIESMVAASSSSLSYSKTTARRSTSGAAANYDINTMVKNVLFTTFNVARSFEDLGVIGGINNGDDTTMVAWLKEFTLQLVANPYVSDEAVSTDERALMFVFLVRLMSPSELIGARLNKSLNEFVLKIVQWVKSLSARVLMMNDVRAGGGGSGGRLASCGGGGGGGGGIGRMSVSSSEMYERVESVYMSVRSSDYGMMGGSAGGGGVVVSLVELLECVHLMSSKKILPCELVRNLNVADDLKTIVENGNECEVEYALKVILSFAFEMSLFNESEIVEIARNILINNKFENRRLINCCKGLIWMYADSPTPPPITTDNLTNSRHPKQRKQQQKEESKKKKKTDSGYGASISSTDTDTDDSCRHDSHHQTTPTPNLMSSSSVSILSSSALDRDDVSNTTTSIYVCGDFKSLEACRDVENELNRWGNRMLRVKYSRMYEPSLEQIFTCIRNADCVLFVLTTSVMSNCCCRLEIEYARRMRKLIVPVGFRTMPVETNGWFAKLIEDMDVYTVNGSSKNELEWQHEMKRLNDHIKNRLYADLDSLEGALNSSTTTTTTP